MAIIEKKTWPEYFNKVRKGRKNIELRLADFRIKKGDTLVLKEWDPKTKKYTGRFIASKVGAVHKVGLFKFYPLKDLKKYDLYMIEME